MKTICRSLGFAMAMLFTLSGSGEERGRLVPFYAGTYTRPGGSKGIYRYELNLQTGQITGGELAGETVNPSFLAVDPMSTHLYATIDTNDGAVAAFAIEKDGKLRRLNDQPSGGGNPAHVSVDPEGKNVLVANYGGGTVAVLPINGDGSLKPPQALQQHRGSSVGSRQKEPHPHGIYVDGKRRFAYVPDLGLDKVMIYRFDAEHGTLAPSDPPFASVPPGSGPRHMAFGRDERVFVVNELASTVAVFKQEPSSGGLQAAQTISTLGGDFTGQNTAAEIVVHPNGRFVYTSNRGQNSIAGFSVEKGVLKPLGVTPCGGAQPRSFAVDPDGKFLVVANQVSNNLIVFRIDGETGALKQAGDATAIAMPVSVVFPGVLDR